MIKNLSRLTEWVTKRFHLLGMLAVLLCLTACGGDIKVTQSLQDQWTADVKNCWPCILYRMVFDSMGRLTIDLYGTSAKSALMLMAVGGLFWIAFKTLGLLTTMQAPDIKKYWSELLKVFFKMIVVSTILLTASNFLGLVNILVTPIMTAFVELSTVVIQADPTFQSEFAVPANYLAMGGEKMSDTGLFSQSIGMQIQDMIYRLFILLKAGTMAGIGLITQWNFTGVIVGLFVSYMFFILMIIFPFSMFEVFFKLGVLIIMLPFILVAWVFPSTSKPILSKAWQIFIGSMIQMLFTCVIVVFVLVVINAFTEQTWPGFLSTSRQLTDARMTKDMQQLSVGTIAFIFVLIFMTKFTQNINQFTSVFGGEAAESEMVKLFTALKNMAIGGIVLVAGAVLSLIDGGTLSSGLIKKGLKQMADSAKDAAKDGGSGSDNESETKESEGSESKSSAVSSAGMPSDKK